jgi:hydroxymethylpyrimidine/phosphomethylpyrimidine kinase
MMRSQGRVLIVAGSDSGGGAGIQADLKTVTALGGYAATAITAVTVQNTLGVSEVHEIPVSVIQAQIEAVLTDIGADSIKTGMLATAEIIETVVAAIVRHAPNAHLVVDPVMVAKGGHRLIDEGAIETLKRDLLPRASIVTPNLPEAEALCGRSITTRRDMELAARHLQVSHGARAVLIKGGHLSGTRVPDVLFDGSTVQWWEDDRIETRHTHGTGCTLASAIAAGLAQGLMMEAAVARAREYVRIALLTAPGLGKGHGPLNHCHTVQAFPNV